MKQFKFLATGIVLSISLLFASCNEGSENKTDETKTDTTLTTTTAEPIAPEKPGNFLLIKQKVANYAKWLPTYESNDSARLANGLTKFVLGRGLGKDSNTVLVALKMDDVTKARELTASKGMKDKMQKAGVIGAPTFAFLETVMLDKGTDASTTRVWMMHKVKDWDAWKKEFDSHKQVRIDAGLTDRAVGYSVGDNHMVTVVCAVTDMEKAKAFMASKDLKDKMAAAGVEGPPTIYFYDVVKSY
ncbi:MAG TPA: hypothetical protein VLR49_01700 [Ferruginibacter sp.]|nr:hypothetical protein [Ferruginibacter sp.]